MTSSELAKQYSNNILQAMKAHQYNKTKTLHTMYTSQPTDIKVTAKSKDQLFLKFIEEIILYTNEEANGSLPSPS